MGRTVREVMTVAPTTVEKNATASDAARAMRDDDVGALLVLDGGALVGVITDRDIAVRTVAEGLDPASTAVTDVCTKDPTAVSADASVGEAVGLMRERALRRLPVIEDGQPVGIVALGDLAVERDPDSALADISASDPNR
jgi:CBS domain-containing protein